MCLVPMLPQAKLEGPCHCCHTVLSWVSGNWREMSTEMFYQEKKDLGL